MFRAPIHKAQKAAIGRMFDIERVVLHSGPVGTTTQGDYRCTS